MDEEKVTVRDRKQRLVLKKLGNRNETLVNVLKLCRASFNFKRLGEG